MHTAVIVSNRGFGRFRFDLLKRKSRIRFVGVFTEADSLEISEDHHAFYDEIHIVPCAFESPDAIGKSAVDEKFLADTMRGILRTTPIQRVSIHSYDEMNVLAAARMRDRFGLRGPGVDTILGFRNKCVMKRKLADEGVRVPKYGRLDEGRRRRSAKPYFEEICERVGLPFVLKPVDAAGAAGVFKVNNFKEFANCDVERNTQYQYEEFVSGTMFSVNIVAQDGESLFAGVTEYLVNSFDVQFGRVNADINLIDTDERVKPMVAFAERALAALGNPDGASHLELFYTREGELIFLEVGARFKGMAGLAAMESHYGLALVNLAFEVETGFESYDAEIDRVYCFDGVLPKEEGVVKELLSPELSSEVSLSWKVSPGEALDQSDSLLANAGTFLVWNQEYETLYRDFRRLAQYRPITYEEISENCS